MSIENEYWAANIQGLTQWIRMERIERLGRKAKDDGDEGDDFMTVMVNYKEQI